MNRLEVLGSSPRRFIDYVYCSNIDRYQTHPSSNMEQVELVTLENLVFPLCLVRTYWLGLPRKRERRRAALVTRFGKISPLIMSFGSKNASSCSCAHKSSCSWHEITSGSLIKHLFFTHLQNELKTKWKNTFYLPHSLWLGFVVSVTELACYEPAVVFIRCSSTRILFSTLPVAERGKESTNTTPP